MKCERCNTWDDNAFYTEINPPGGYGRDRVLVCDACMRSGDLDWWKAEHWPNWPEKPIA